MGFCISKCSDKFDSIYELINEIKSSYCTSCLENESISNIISDNKIIQLCQTCLDKYK